MTDHVSRIREQWLHERPDLNTEPMAIIGRLHRIGAYLLAEIDRVHGEYGLTEGEFDVLATLRRAGAPYALTPGEIADWTMVTSGAVTKRVDRLERAGLVSRERAVDDGRGRVVSLTAEGLERIDRAMEAHMDNERNLVSALSWSQRAELTQLLTNWAESIENR